MRVRSRALVLELVGLCALGGASCSEGDQLSTVAPELVLSPSELDFGEVPIGATGRGTVEVSNVGNAPLVVSDPMVAAPFFAEPLERTLAPGQSALMQVGFRPRNVETQTATLGVASNDVGSASTLVLLRGLGGQGSLTVSPSRIDLSGTPVGTRRVVELELENLGIAEVSGSVVLEPFEGVAHFSTDGGPVERDFVAPPQSRSLIELAYLPLVPGEHGGALRFEICGDGCGVEVEVVATAVQPAVRAEPVRVDFGEVGLGEQRVRNLTLRNGGNEVAQILALELPAGASVRFVSEPALPVELEPGGLLAVELAYAPTAAAALAEVLKVQLGAPVLLTVEVALIGQGVGPAFVVSPESLNIGPLRQDTPTRRLVLAVNAGSAEVEVTNLQLDGDAELSFETLPSLPVRLGGGESMDIPVLYSPSGVGTHTATLTVDSSDAATPRVQVPVRGARVDRACAMEPSRPTLEFGQVVPGYTRQQSVVLTNRGDASCLLSEGAFRAPVDAAVSLVGASPFPVSVAPGDTLTLTFEFAPSSESETKAIYAVRSDAPLAPWVNLGLVGTGKGYIDLVVQPRAVDFGEVGHTCPPTSQSFVVTNAGSGAVRIESTVVDTGSSGDLSIVASAAPVSLPVGASQDFTVEYAPSGTGRDEGNVLLRIDARSYEVVVPVMGDAVEAPLVIDTFEQRSSSNGVDVLFVIDNSCSMGDEQVELAQSFGQFIDGALQLGTQFRIGVTTTDVYFGRGLLVGPPLTPSTNGISAAFARQTAVGISGSGIEQGLEAAYLAVTSGLSSPNNRDLFRSSSGKAIVVVSDEDDYSPRPVPYYVAQLEAALGKPLFVGITGQAAGCNQPGQAGYSTPAPRYEQTVQSMQGLSLPICGDWASTLEQIGNRVFGLQSDFFLSRRARAGTVEVSVDGTRQPSDAYSVNGLGDQVSFVTPPSEGSVIEIRYTPLCQ